MSVQQLQIAECGPEEEEATPDGELVQLHLDGDAEAFEDLYRQYFDRLVRLCRARTNDQAAAEDLAQETLLRALSNMTHFQLDRPMWPWLKTIATRLVIDQSRQKRVDLCPDPADNRAVLDDTAWLEERPILEEAMAGMPSRQRVALALRYLDDWSPAEAADALGMSRPAFDQLLFRARGKLRREYRRVCGDSPTILRVALWPLLALYGRVRGHALRVRSTVEAWAGAVQVSGEAVTSLVMAATIGAAAVGAAIAVSPTESRLDSGPRPGEALSDNADLAAVSNFTVLSSATASGIGAAHSPSPARQRPESFRALHVDRTPQARAALPDGYAEYARRVSPRNASIAFPRPSAPAAPSSEGWLARLTPSGPAGAPEAPARLANTPTVPAPPQLPEATRPDADAAVARPDTPQAGEPQAPNAGNAVESSRPEVVDSPDTTVPFPSVSPLERPDPDVAVTTPESPESPESPGQPASVDSPEHDGRTVAIRTS